MSKCPMCPYYIQQTSYGTELVKCDNQECPNRSKEGDSNADID